MLKRYVIEREIAGVGSLAAGELANAAKTSNEAIAQVDGVQWDHSYVADNKTFCVYLATGEEQILEHARRSGFPANRITEISKIIDPTTQRGPRNGDAEASALQRGK